MTSHFNFSNSNLNLIGSYETQNKPIKCRLEFENLYREVTSSVESILITSVVSVFTSVPYSDDYCCMSCHTVSRVQRQFKLMTIAWKFYIRVKIT